MRYIGSKTSTLPVLTKLVVERIPHGSFCDPFGGIGTVGSAFKSAGFTVHTGDILRFAHCFQIAHIALSRRPRPTPVMRRELGLATSADLLAELARTPPVRSWVYREFSQSRQYFSAENAARIDGIRRRIAAWLRDGLTSPTIDRYLRACLIDAMDRVANTAGTYYAHLKEWTRKARQPLRLRAIEPGPGPRGSATLGDAKDLVSSRRFDVLYLDPPYNARDYAGYYHLPETIASGRRPRPTGLSGVDAAPRPISAFTRPAQAVSAMAELVDLARCDLMIVHYSDDGLVPPAKMRSMLRSVGRVDDVTVPALGYGTTHQRLTTHRLYLVEP